MNVSDRCVWSDQRGVDLCSILRNVRLIRGRVTSGSFGTSCLKFFWVFYAYGCAGTSAKMCYVDFFMRNSLSDPKTW